MNNLKKIRLENKLSREELSAKLGLTSRYIAFLEKGERNPSLPTAYRISNFFNKPVEDIFLNTKCTKSTNIKGEINE